VNRREIAFTPHEMGLFAGGSGDRSALHTDPDFAAGTTFGACIVYGGMLTIALLGSLPPAELARLRSVRSSFPGPVYPGEPLLLQATAHPSRDGAWEIGGHAHGKLVARTLTDTRRDVARAEATIDRAAAEPARTAYGAGAELRALAAGLGAEALHPALLEGIAWASYLVGTGAAGIQGLCAAVDVTVAADSVSAGGTAEQGWSVLADRDARSGRHLMEGILYDGAGVARSVVRVELFPVPTKAAAAR
jgi:acyl dehydratase